MGAFDDYTRGALRTRNPGLSDRDRLLDPACGLAEEAGEVLALVRKHLMQGVPLDRDRLALELGDVLWCLAATAEAAGLSLDDVARRNLDKLARRHGGAWSDRRERSVDG
ncbi:MAG: nucleoside triphosphate pyrophosphohydrolase family protein [Gemmatimonadaceae bacterium]|nr:nucleoside triphosphate pyrophosphohydrolase family protein [Gemmatimonadaceae bacterium]